MTQKKSSQAGFVPILVLLVVGVVGLFILSKIPVTRHYNDGTGNVAGASTSSNGIQIIKSGDASAIVQGAFGALTNFSLNQTGENIVVTTPVGDKNLAVYPQDAIKNIEGAHVLDDIKSIASKDPFTSISHLVTLTEENGVLGYEINGDKKNQVLGVFTVKNNVSAFVSAQNGQLVQTQQSLLGKLLNKI